MVLPAWRPNGACLISRLFSGKWQVPGFFGSGEQARRVGMPRARVNNNNLIIIIIISERRPGKRDLRDWRGLRAGLDGEAGTPGLMTVAGPGVFQGAKKDQKKFLKNYFWQEKRQPPGDNGQKPGANGGISAGGRLAGAMFFRREGLKFQENPPGPGLTAKKGKV